jgi:DNA-directed RNA polymerase specialized sigma24 family protein/ribosome-associated translation inhibitor RaiA
MNVHVSYKVSKSPDLEQQINQNIEKLRKRLQVFKPDLMHLHAIVEERPARAGFCVRLDLRLPSGDLASSEMADRAESAIKGAFEDLIELITKHKDRLRAQHQWPRQRRVSRTRPVSQVPFEETLAAVRPDAVSGTDISTYINANLERLQRFVERELRYRESNGDLRPYQLNPKEVIGEAIANALGQEERPEKLGLEPWLYRLSLNAIRNLSERNGDGVDSVQLEDSARWHSTTISQGSDEALLQFHQPDETFTTESMIPDRGVATPEESAASDEMVNLVEVALLGATQEDREAFLLFGIEGFTVDEISAISMRPSDDVRKSIKSAREHLRKHLPVPGEFKDKLLQHTKIA